jgi:hypothetical protein
MHCARRVKCITVQLTIPICPATSRPLGCASKKRRSKKRDQGGARGRGRPPHYYERLKPLEEEEKDHGKNKKL